MSYRKAGFRRRADGSTRPVVTAGAGGPPPSTEWVAERAERIASALVETEPDVPVAVGGRRSKQSPAERLGLTVTRKGPFNSDVVCPYCGGVRTVTPGVLRNWLNVGRVPSCEAVKRMNRGTHCRQTTAEAGHAE